MDDLPRLFNENPEIREEFISMLTDFCHRHGIEASPDDLVGLGGETEVQGYVAPVGGPQIFFYRDGPRYSRWIDSGIMKTP
jgi:hypothetical protein